MRACFIVDGVVQKPGYRDFVGGVARNLEVRGIVEDLEDMTIGVIAEAEETVLEEFQRRIHVTVGFRARDLDELSSSPYQRSLDLSSA